MGHLQILFAFVNLIMGVLVLAYIYQRGRGRGGEEPFHLRIGLHLLGYNLITAIMLLDRYLSLNLFDRLDIGLGSPLANGLLILLSLVIYFMAYELMTAVACLAGRRPSRSRDLAFLAFSAVYALALVLVKSLPAGAAAKPLLDSLADFSLLLPAFASLLRLLWALVEARRLRASATGAALRGFALLYLSRYAAFLFLILESIARGSPGVRYTAWAQAFFFYFTLVPLLWYRICFPASSLSGTEGSPGAAGPPSAGPPSIEGFAARYGLSAREAEIASLVIQGKSNREIAELLFISEHTVKNHVYNLFKKTGVGNRVELLALASGYTA